MKIFHLVFFTVAHLWLSSALWHTRKHTNKLFYHTQTTLPQRPPLGAPLHIGHRFYMLKQHSSDYILKFKWFIKGNVWQTCGSSNKGHITWPLTCFSGSTTSVVAHRFKRGISDCCRWKCEIIHTKPSAHLPTKCLRLSGGMTECGTRKDRKVFHSSLSSRYLHRLI